MRTPMFGGLVLLFALGCGGSHLAQVSGKVTMDGKPLAGAVVSFTPMSDEKSTESPLASSGTTNEKGEYTLETVKGQKGAIVGKHKVSITLIVSDPESDERVRGKPIPKEGIPKQYNEQTTLTCDVPAGGRSDANFELKDDKPRQRSK